MRRTRRCRARLSVKTVHCSRMRPRGREPRLSVLRGSIVVSPPPGSLSRSSTVRAVRGRTLRSGHGQSLRGPNGRALSTCWTIWAERTDSVRRLDDAGPGRAPAAAGGQPRRRRGDRAAARAPADRSRHGQAQVPAARSPRSWTRVRRGPPVWSAFGLAGVEPAVNMIEFFVHHEDVLRASSPERRRELSSRDQDEIWSRAGWSGKAFARGACGRSRAGADRRSRVDPDQGR